MGFVLDFEREMEKLLVSDFSVLKLYLKEKDHVFGAFVLRLFGMNRIRTNIQKLKLVLPGWFQVIIHIAYI